MLNPFSKEYKEAVKKLGRDYKTVYNETAKAYKEGLKTYDEDKRKSDEEAKRKLEEEKAGWPKTGIVGDCLQIVDKYGKLFTCPVDQAKLYSIDDKKITITVKGHFLDKTFFFDEKDKEAYERIADALPSDIWYRDQTAMTHVATYKNVNDANKEAMLAAKKGWMPQGSSTTDGNFNVGAGIGAAFLLGPIGLLAAANKTGGKITITYVRTPEWLTSRKTN